jgi:hypothetical protein
MQKNERLRALYTNCLASEGTGAQLSVCDSFFAFKKTALLESGGFHPCGAGEESDLLLRLHALMRRKKRRMTARFLPTRSARSCRLERMRENHARNGRNGRGASKRSVCGKGARLFGRGLRGTFLLLAFEASRRWRNGGNVGRCGPMAVGAVGHGLPRALLNLSILLRRAAFDGRVAEEE